MDKTNMTLYRLMSGKSYKQNSLRGLNSGSLESKPGLMWLSGNELFRRQVVLQAIPDQPSGYHDQLASPSEPQPITESKGAQ